jgi:hypothetical protein
VISTVEDVGATRRTIAVTSRIRGACPIIPSISGIGVGSSSIADSAGISSAAAPPFPVEGAGVTS